MWNYLPTRKLEIFGYWLSIKRFFISYQEYQIRPACSATVTQHTDYFLLPPTHPTERDVPEPSWQGVSRLQVKLGCFLYLLTRDFDKQNHWTWQSDDAALDASGDPCLEDPGFMTTGTQAETRARTVTQPVRVMQRSIFRHGRLKYSKIACEFL